MSVSSDSELVLEMPSQPRFLAAARGMIGALSERLGFSESECGRIALALDEALCNVINHGYERRDDGQIWVRVSLDEATTPAMRLVIEDRARQVDLESIRSRDLDDIRPGGLGVHIIREVMDEVHYEHRDGGGMRLTMIKKRKQGEGRDASNDHCEGHHG